MVKRLRTARRMRRTGSLAAFSRERPR